MLSTPAAKLATTLTFAALFSAPFGVPIESMAIGTVFATIGVIGRGMIEIMKTLERGDQLKLIRSLGWIAAGIVGSPFVSILYLATLTAAHIPIDALAIVALLILGYAGPKTVSQIADFIRDRLVLGLTSTKGGQNGSDHG